MATILNVDLPENENHLDWLRRVNNALDQYVYADVSSGSEFQQRLHNQLAKKVERLRGDIIRVQHLIGISESPQFKPLTPVRLAAKVAKLEQEVLGKVSYKGMRLAELAVGNPISLIDYMDDYHASRDETIAELTDRMRNALQSLIDRLDVIQQKDYVSSLPRS